MNLMHHLAILLTFLFIMLVKNTWYNSGSGIQELLSVQTELRELRSLNVTLQEKNRRVEASIDGIKHHSDAREELARKHLGLIKKNETFYHITPASN